MDKTKQLGLLTAVAILAVLAGGWFLLVSPQRSHASDLRTQKATQEQANQQLQAQIASLQAQHKDLPQVQAQLAKLATQLPNNPGLPSLIRQLSAAADNAGVDLVSLAPSAPSVVSTTPSAPAAGTGNAANAASATAEVPATAPSGPVIAAPSATGSLASVPIVIVVNGGYFQVEQFMSNLEALKRSFLTTQLDIAPGNPPAAGGAGAGVASTSTDGYVGRLTATVTGQVFMVSNIAAPAAPAPAATTAK